MKEIYIVHAVDTEGPLYESLDATFVRLYQLFNLKFKNHTLRQLKRIQEGKDIPLNVNKNSVKKAISPHLLNYNKNWKEIKKMLTEIFDKKFRSKLLDSANNEYVLTWHCVDHVNYKINPRKKTLGYSKIFNFYKNFLKKNKSKDKLNFHFHPFSTYGESHKNSSLYFRNDNLYQILCRRIIDHKWFPTANRAGFHVERPDSHWFLEQYIPFDLSNTNQKSNKKKSIDDSISASGWDWRRATTEWKIYKPSHDDYQVPGNCRRYIGRVLSINNRVESINIKEVLKAFKRANSGKKTLLAVTSHDHRNFISEIEEFTNYIKQAKKKYPKVKFYYVDTAEGFRKTLRMKNSSNKKLKLDIIRLKNNSFKIIVKRGKVFGPQPFLAIKFKNGRYFHDNLDFGLVKNEWFYTLNEHTVKPKDVKYFAVGASDDKGNFYVKKISLN